MLFPVVANNMQCVYWCHSRRDSPPRWWNWNSDYNEVTQNLYHAAWTKRHKLASFPSEWWMRHNYSPLLIAKRFLIFYAVNFKENGLWDEITFKVCFLLSSAAFLLSISSSLFFWTSFSFSRIVTRSFFLTKTGFSRTPVSSSESAMSNEIINCYSDFFE